ncbi:MAG: T9SS type A sorting domain-containing protein [Saprospiraceae bacterium]|uniref:T9SS type A sorting domain-containing protein n=1 Tax=Candidatus Opimibacter skivensis TaxID=2982028 RepID=A0A9D7SRZ4_9BACT|nr:T9SS type A sorting domain-containing protein [Candidatus Opimibacter skivensis]
MKIFLTLLCFALTACSLFSQDWVRQHPFVGFAPLHAITFDSNGNGWAAGQQSLIMHTSDGGDIWTVQKKGLPVDATFEAIEIVPSTNAQIVLVGGPNVFISKDGGETWSSAGLPEGLDAVSRIQAFDTQHWIASGVARGAKTSDGGQSWTYFAMPDNSARGTWFNDMNTGWTGSGPFNANQIFRTTNGGVDWVLADDDIYPIITDIAMINSQTGFMSARDFMYKTIDGGATWNKLHTDVQPSLTKMHVVSEDIIWSGLNNGFVFFTLNGGIDWEQINPNLINSNQVFDVYASDDGRAWIPGKYASMQYTSDNGQTWKDQTPGSKNSLFDVEFKNNTGVAVGSDGLILFTTDGGAIWENIGYDPQSTYLSLSLYTAPGQGHVYLGSTNGQVLHRSLTDTQWESIGNNLGDINTIYALSDQVILAGTFDHIMRTTDAGLHWDAVESTSYFVGEFVFPNTQTGYAAIEDGRIVKTLDGGATWNTVLQKGSAYKFTGIDFQDVMNGWAIAELKDSVFTTKDGGITWKAYKLPSNTFWQDVEFMDKDTGYISGGSAGSGIILRTVNGGEKWTLSFNESERLNKMFVRPGEDYVWVVGFGGNILHYSPCAVTPEISDLTGDSTPCVGSIATYEVSSSGATLFSWTVPAGWTIIGNDNSARVEVLVGPGNGVMTIHGANTCGTQTNQLSINVSPLVVGQVSITELSGSLSTTLDGVTYQWLQDGEEIAGATNSSFTPVNSGTFSLIVTFLNGCTATSNEIFVMVSGILETEKKYIQIYPNPVTDFLSLQMENILSIRTIKIYGSNGCLVSTIENESKQIDVSGLVCGVYFVQVKTDADVFVGRFVKK